MSYYKDLSTYEYLKCKNDIDKGYRILNIGWIDGLHEFNKGNVPDKFIPLLWEYIMVPINRTRGLHYDCVLDGQDKTFIARFQRYEIKLGDAEIRVLDEEHKIIYASPNMILHYIIDHKYCPPQCFIDAVMNGPKPGSNSYKKILIEKQKNNIRSKLRCIFCGGYQIRLGYYYNINHDETKSIEVVEQESDINILQEKSVYNVICKECGGIFNVPFKEIIK